MRCLLFSWSFPGGYFSASFSDTEIGVKLVHVGLQLCIREAIDDPAVFDDVVAVRNGCGEPEILFDQEDGETFVLETFDGVTDLLDDDGRKALGRLRPHP